MTPTRLNYGGFPVRTKETLESYRLPYFAKPTRSQAGDVRHPRMPILVTPQRTSILVVEVQERTLKVAMHEVRNARGDVYMTHSDYYGISGKSWRVVEITWESGHVEELGTYPARDNADIALHEIHADR